MKLISEKQFDEERALYNLSDARLDRCRFEGPRDGESALKETKNLTLNNCFFDLRYPLWHTKNAALSDCAMTENCRAAMWYDDGLTVEKSHLTGIKALRECRNVKIKNSTVTSPEFGWFSHHLLFENCTLTGEYPFLKSSDLELLNFTLFGKYSFQYVENMEIQKSALHTKDAFWHTKNVTVRDSLVEGEYLGWYSENLTLVNCHIKGTQPFCYCKNLVLLNCTMENTDLAFEKSSVCAAVTGHIDSVKNPLSGSISADTIGEIILDGETPCVITSKKA